MKADILNYLSGVVQSIAKEIEREINPAKLIQLRAQVEVVNMIAAEIKRALPDEMKSEPDAEMPTPVEAEIVS